MNEYLKKVNDVLSKKTKSTEILNENNNDLIRSQKEIKKPKRVFQKIFDRRK